MLDFSRRLQILLSGPKAAASRALIATLDHAARNERDALALAALETGRPEAATAVVARLHLFGENVARALARCDALDNAVQIVLRRAQPATSLNAIKAIEVGPPALLRHLVPLLASPSEVVAERAGQALLGAVTGHLGDSGRRATAPEIVHAIDHAVTAALEAYPAHRNRDALLAAAIASARSGPKLADLLRDASSSAALALRSIVAETDRPLVRRNMLSWLGVPALSIAATRWMHRLRGQDQFDDLLRRGHLLRDPKRRRALRKVDRSASCIPPASVAAAMDNASQRWLVELAASIGLSTEARIASLSNIAALPSPLARLRTASDLAALAGNDPRARAALEQLCIDDDPAVASTALRYRLCAAVGSPDVGSETKLLTQALHAGSADLGRAARLRLAQERPAVFFEHWLALPEQQRLIAAHHLLDRDLDSFARELRKRIENSPRDERLAAIGLSRRLRLIDHVIEPLLVLTTSPDARIASTAVAAIASSRHARCAEAARTALRHAHPRVRANAVEAIAACADQALLELVGPMMSARENRVRANAICAAIEHKPIEAESNLRSMLRDTNPMQRISGLWAARRGRVSAVMNELTLLADLDPLEPIRTRAAAAQRSIQLLTEQPAGTAFELLQEAAP